MKKIRQVYLFDIDGTLVNAQGVGSAAFRQAVLEVVGLGIEWRGVAFAGQTDAGLLERAASEAGRKISPELTHDFFARYHFYLAEALMRRPAMRLPGAEALITRLAGEGDSVLALLTGNTRQSSELKLADLFPAFQFGIFGEHHTDRRELGRAARRHADEKFGKEVRLTIIGDTPNDIACARAAGAEAVAVATGHFNATELSHADRVFANLTHWSFA
jgi:phosphoglycolate phosphatase